MRFFRRKFSKSIQNNVFAAEPIILNEENPVLDLTGKTIEGPIIVESGNVIIKGDGTVTSPVYPADEPTDEPTSEGAIGESTTTEDEKKEEAKDETPKTGAISFVAILAVIALAGLVFVKRK